MNSRYKNLYKAYRLSKYYIPGDENFSEEEDEYNFRMDSLDYMNKAWYIRNRNLRVYSKRRKLIKKYDFYRDLLLQYRKDWGVINMLKVTAYKCQFCDKKFHTTEECLNHELYHIGINEKIFKKWRGLKLRLFKLRKLAVTTGPFSHELVHSSDQIEYILDIYEKEYGLVGLSIDFDNEKFFISDSFKVKNP